MKDNCKKQEFIISYTKKMNAADAVRLGLSMQLVRQFRIIELRSVGHMVIMVVILNIFCKLNNLTIMCNVFNVYYLVYIIYIFRARIPDRVSSKIKLMLCYPR